MDWICRNRRRNSNNEVLHSEGLVVLAGIELAIMVICAFLVMYRSVDGIYLLLVFVNMVTSCMFIYGASTRKVMIIAIGSILCVTNFTIFLVCELMADMPILDYVIVPHSWTTTGLLITVYILISMWRALTLWQIKNCLKQWKRDASLPMHVRVEGPVA